MIVISKERFYYTNPNIIMLEKDDNFFYSHRNVYDQAVILNYVYNSNIEDVLITLDPNFKNNNKAYEWLKENLPKPLNILAPFIYLVDSDLGDDYEDYCGALQVITSQISVASYIKLDKSIRSGLSWSSSIKEEYRMSWDLFIQSSRTSIMGSISAPTVTTEKQEVPEGSADYPTEEEFVQEAGELEEGEMYFVEEHNPDLDGFDMGAFMDGTDEDESSEENEHPTLNNGSSNASYEKDEIKAYKGILV